MVMREVVLEVLVPGGWRHAGSVSDFLPPGSLSSEPPSGREVVLFGFLDDRPGVWRSVGGLDMATDAVRAVSSLGFDQLADLTEGPYEMDRYPAGGEPTRIRFRLRN